MRKPLLVILGLALAAPLAAQDRGLTATADALGGPRWQARFEQDLPLTSLLGPGRPAPLLGSMTGTLRLLGDYQFNLLRLGDTGGLRLTGGVLINLRPAQGGGFDAGAMAQGAVGYAGVGYAFGSQRGWGFSADLGLTGLGLGTAGGAGGASTELRGQPMIRLGVNMAF